MKRADTKNKSRERRLKQLEKKIDNILKSSHLRKTATQEKVTDESNYVANKKNVL
jgi:phosphohistidine phosphatase SixA